MEDACSSINCSRAGLLTMMPLTNNETPRLPLSKILSNCSVLSIVLLTIICRDVIVEPSTNLIKHKLSPCFLICSIQPQTTIDLSKYNW